MKSIIILVAIFLSSVSLMAQDINIKQSSFIWKGSKITGDYHSGPIKLKTAYLKDGKGEFVVDMSSIEDTTLEGKWKKKFLDHIKSEDFFNVKKYPVAKLKIEKMDNGYLYGQLTIKDKTNPVTIAYVKKGNTYTGELGFDRTKFNMIYGSGNFFKNLGDKVIADTVTLKFTVVIK